MAPNGHSWRMCSALFRLGNRATRPRTIVQFLPSITAKNAVVRKVGFKNIPLRRSGYITRKVDVKRIDAKTAAQPQLSAVPRSIFSDRHIRPIPLDDRSRQRFTVGTLR